MNDIKITNDSKTQTLIEIKVDNTKINHSQLNRFIAELADLGLKYSIIPVREGEYNVNNN